MHKQARVKIKDQRRRQNPAHIQGPGFEKGGGSFQELVFDFED
jgi:hypothetical protein